MGQKGYNSAKYCQEVLITLVDEINTAKTNHKKGALLSLDIRKAFDTISHQYINKAYRFFNFGENFIKWLNLIGTNRKACIILENGLYSSFLIWKEETLKVIPLRLIFLISDTKFYSLN
jgi:hypothetical protein